MVEETRGAHRAGAGFGFGTTTDALEQEMLVASFRWFWELAERHPESSVRVRVRSCLDYGRLMIQPT
jgi:hypothetical protein